MESAPAEIIYQHHTDFQTIEVSQDHKRRQLRTDQRAIQSTLLLTAPEQLVLPYMKAMMVALLFQPPPRRILLLGLGGGDMVRFLHHHLPQTQISTVELDPAMIEVSQRYFALPNSARITVHADDALNFINRDEGRYDLLLVDIYSGAEIPVFLQRDHFYQRCHQLLENDGILVLNLLTTDATQFRDILWIIRQRFERSTLCLTVPGHTNVLIFAFRKRPTLLTMAPLQAKAQQFKQAFDLDLSEWVTQLFSTNPTDGGELIF